MTGECSQNRSNIGTIRWPLIIELNHLVIILNRQIEEKTWRIAEVSMVHIPNCWEFVNDMATDFCGVVNDLHRI